MSRFGETDRLRRDRRERPGRGGREQDNGSPGRRGVIHIRQQLFRASGRLHLGPVKTPAGRRDLPLLGIVRDALFRQSDLRVIGASSHEWTGAALVFTTRTGCPVESRNLARSFERITASAGLRPIRPHDLRHTTATLVKDLGVPPRDTMDILGHSRLPVTMEVYTGTDDASRREALGKLTGLFGADRHPFEATALG